MSVDSSSGESGTGADGVVQAGGLVCNAAWQLIAIQLRLWTAGVSAWSSTRRAGEAQRSDAGWCRDGEIRDRETAECTLNSTISILALVLSRWDSRTLDGIQFLSPVCINTMAVVFRQETEGNECWHSQNSGREIMRQGICDKKLFFKGNVKSKLTKIEHPWSYYAWLISACLFI